MELKDYDKYIERLSAIIEELSKDNVSLEDNIRLYEEGKNIHARLSKLLKEEKGKLEEVIGEETLSMEDLD